MESLEREDPVGSATQRAIRNVVLVVTLLGLVGVAVVSNRSPSCAGAVPTCLNAVPSHQQPHTNEKTFHEVVKGDTHSDGKQQPAVHASWSENYSAAIHESKLSGKPLLVEFVGSDWCPWCIKLHEEVFSQPEFQRWAIQTVVLLTVDFPTFRVQSNELRHQNAALAKKYDIPGYPTVLFLDQDGHELGRSGYMDGGAKPWIADAAKQLTDAQQKNGGAK